MKALLAADNETLGAAVRQVLLREGLDCPASEVVRIEVAPERLTGSPADLFVMVLPDDPVRAVGALEMLEKMPRQEGTRVLAVGPAADPKMVLRALRGAVDDYLDRDDLEAELEAALARWRASRPDRDEAGRVIAVLAPSGGSGSSTLAANIATVLAKQHETSALIDLKFHTGDLAPLLDLKPTYSLADLCMNVGRLDRVLFERSMARHQSGVHLLAPPAHFGDVDRVTSEGIRKVLHLARGMFPYVVMDVDHHFGAEQVDALLRSDIVLVVIRLDFASLRNARRAIEHLERLGMNRDRLRLVVNRYGQPKEVPYAKAEEALGLKISHYVPEDPKAVNRANNNGVPVVIESPSARVAKSLTKLAESVNGRHKVEKWATTSPMPAPTSIPPRENGFFSFWGAAGGPCRSGMPPIPRPAMASPGLSFNPDDR
jgi:pilus assembly protein CpaE